MTACLFSETPGVVIQVKDTDSVFKILKSKGIEAAEIGAINVDENPKKFLNFVG